jgi:UPF0716 protein FxsA
MAIFILAAFIGVPLLEIAVFIQVGGWIGLGWTLALVILTAVLGTWQLRAQGLATLMRAREQIDHGALPARELFDGACLLVGGVLLLTPGFVTDSAGFLLFFPPVRDILRELLARYVQTSLETRRFVGGEEVCPGGPDGPGRGPGGGPERTPGGARGPVIDGEFRDVSETTQPKRPKSHVPESQGRESQGRESQRKFPE